MQFINIVVHSVEDMNFRVHLQYDFTKLNLEEHLEVNPNPTVLLVTSPVPDVPVQLLVYRFSFSPSATYLDVLKEAVMVVKDRKKAPKPPTKRAPLHSSDIIDNTSLTMSECFNAIL